MLQLNLLPDVKIEFIKAQRTKRMVMGSAMIAIGASVGVMLLLVLIVYGLQKKNMSDLNGDISKYSDQLKNTPDLNKILTIQNQLNTLPDLHNQKVVSSRLFQVAAQTTPQGVTISDFTTDFTLNTMSITGASQSLDQVNTFVDTLKYASFMNNNQSGKAFSQVVLSQFGRSETGTTFTITLSLDPALFAIKTPYNLTVPKQVTTDSITGQPTEIFKQAPTGAGAQ